MRIWNWLWTPRNRKGGIGVIPMFAIVCGLIVGTLIINMVVGNFRMSTSFQSAYDYLTGQGYTVFAGSPTGAWNPAIDNSYNLGTAALRWKDIRGVNSTVTGTATVGGLTATSNLDIGSFDLRAQTFTSDVATGTSPFTVASTTKVTNLYSDFANQLSTTNLKLYQSDANTLSLETLTGGTYKSLQLGTIALKQVTAPGAATVAVNVAAGNLNGTYYYRITFVNPNGETGVGTESAAVSPANQQVDLSNIPTSADTSVTARNIYRVKSPDSPSYGNFKYVAQLAGNVSTTYTDNVLDATVAAAANAPWSNTTGGLLTQNGDLIGQAGLYSTSWGHDALKNNKGSSNVAVGNNALYTNTIGFYNVAVGANAMLSNISSPYNTAVGFSSLRSITASAAIPDNTAVGAYSLYSLTTGGQNTALGVEALYSNVSGSENTALGWWTLMSSTASNNTAVGSQSMLHNTTGGSNTAVGWDSLHRNTISVGNVAVGFDAMGNGVIPGDYNVAVGMNALYTQQWGSAYTTQNVAVGYNALVAANNAVNNTAIGANTLKSATTGTNITALGSGAGFSVTTAAGGVFLGGAAGYYETAANKLFIDNAARASEADGRAKALIYGVFAATTPAQYLTVNGNFTINGALSLNTPTPYTIGAGGDITITSSYITLAGAGGAADNLDTINGGMDGQVITLRAVSDAVDITVRDDGNIKVAGATDFVMDSYYDTMTLIYDSTLAKWLEISRATNG